MANYPAPLAYVIDDNILVAVIPKEANLKEGDIVIMDYSYLSDDGRSGTGEGGRVLVTDKMEDHAIACAMSVSGLTGKVLVKYTVTLKAGGKFISNTYPIYM